MAGSPSLDRHPRVGQWIAIAPEGRITVRSGKVDIGQRISTAIALIAAEELEIDPARVDVAPPTTGVSPDEGYSSGSNSMEHSGAAVRLAAASARRRLLALAARALDVDPATLEVADGLVRSRAANRSITYWELAPGGLETLDVDPAVETRAPASYRHLGRRAVARGMAGLIDGSARFVHDLDMPDMLHARVVRPPHYRARLEALDPSIESRLGDAQLVRDGSFLAVAAEDEHVAVRAAERVAAAARWTPREGLEPQDVYARLVENPRVSLPVIDGTPRVAPVPPLASPPAGAVATVEARYERPYTMHGSLGPSAAIARFEGGRLEVWTHSQGIYPLRATIAEALDLDEESVRLVHVPGAGCYGHNGADDAAFDAALVARAMPGRPVMLKWTRDDEHAWEPYGSCMVVQVRASLDGAGRVIDFSLESHSDAHINRPRLAPEHAGPARLLATHHLAEPLDEYLPQPSMGHHAGIHRNADPYYAFPRRRVVKHLVRELPLRTSSLRMLGAFANVFAIESTMDELAAAAGADPLAFRLAHLDDPRARAVIEAAAKRLGYRRAARAPGRGHGLAFARYKNTKAYAAVAVELDVGDDAVVHLRRAVVAADAGEIVDADGLAAQLEGGFLQAASWALHEEVTFDAGGITSRDWESYPVLRFDEVPEVETVLVPRPGDPFLGVGEAAGGPTAGAIANAIHDATGLRLRRLPFRPDAIRAAAL